MANSVELRSPLLNSEIIKFVFGSLNSSYKVKKNQKNYFKKLMFKILPKSFTLDKKRGFSIPINDYFNQKELENKRTRNIIG